MLIYSFHGKLWCFAGEFKLSTLDKYVHKTPKPPIGRPVQKKGSVLPSLRVTPSVSKNQVNLVNSKQPATSKQQVSIGKQPIVAETAPKSKPQVRVFSVLMMPLITDFILEQWCNSRTVVQVCFRLTVILKFTA